MIPPRLVEPTSIHYMMNTLQQCHTARTNLYYNMFNIGVLVIFVLVAGITLYYCSKDKLSDYEKQQKLLKGFCVTFETHPSVVKPRQSVDIW